MHAIERATGCTLDISDFRVRSLGIGSDAQGLASLVVTHDGKEIRGNGVSTDIVEAAAQAALEVVNRIERLTPIKMQPTTQDAPRQSQGAAR